MIKKFNNLLALVLFSLIIGLWILQGLAVIDLDGTEVIGATIAIATLMAQYFFRKRAPTDRNGT